MDPNLAPPAAGWVPSATKNQAVPSHGLNIDINALLSHLSEKFPGYLEHFFRPAAKKASVEEVIALDDEAITPSTSSSSSSSKSTRPPTKNSKGSTRPSVTPSTPAKGNEPTARPEASSGPSAQPSNSAEEAEDVEMSSATPQPTGEFTEVTSRSQKRKLKAAKSQADPPVKVFASAKRTPKGKPPKPASAEADEAATLDRIPPLYVREKTHWDKLVPMLDQQGIAFSHARSTAIGIRVQCPDSLNHRRLSALLRKDNIGFHTYALQDERVLRAVIKGLPREISTELIKEDLVSQEIPVIEVHRMYNRRTKQPYDMVLVVAELSAAGKRLYDLASICRLSGLKIETPMGKGRKMQCHNCQLYGHGARYCYAQPRCVKCLSLHLTADCPRKQPTEEPPSCVLCGTKGHPANYRGCPKAPKEAKRKGNSAASQSAAPPSDPKFVPAPAPKTNAWSKPLNRPKPAQATAESGSAPPNPPSAGAKAAPKAKVADPFDNESLRYINHVIDTVDLDELDEFLEESKVNPQQALIKHAKLIRAVKALRYNA